MTQEEIDAAGGLHSGEPKKWNLVRRCDWQSGCSRVSAQEWKIEGFTKKYGVHRLVWAERHDRMDSAIVREKHIKKWNRAW